MTRQHLRPSLCLLYTGFYSLVFLVLNACSTATTNGAEHTQSFAIAVADPSRIAEHRERDANRRPADVLQFAFPEGVDGQVITDIVPGAGYYSGILSRAVGPQGRVVAVDPVRIFEVVPAASKAFAEYLLKDPLANVDYSQQKLDEIEFGTRLDGAIMILYYHDTYWTGVDRAAMNQRIFAALKPGARLLIVDHHAQSGADPEVNRALHRMDAALVRPELEAAGFEFIGSSPVLENAVDPLTDSVFLAERRGRTHRFVYLFRRPRA